MAVARQGHLMDVLGALGALSLSASGDIKAFASTDKEYTSKRYNSQVIIPLDFDWSVGILHFPNGTSGSIVPGQTYLVGINSEFVAANFSGANPSFTVYIGFDTRGVIRWVDNSGGYHRDKYQVIFIKVA